MSMLTITVNLDNSSFRDFENPEEIALPAVADTVADVARRIRSTGYVIGPTDRPQGGPVMDVNGNRVGDWRVSP